VPAADASIGRAALFKYAREVTDTEEAVVPGAMSSEFVAAAAALHPLLRRALVEDQVDEDDVALVELLGCTLLSSTRRVLRRRGAIDAAGCAALRRAVDAQRDVTRDSVDNMAQHQLNIDADRLTALIGRPQVLALFRMADELLATQRAEANARAEATGRAPSAATLEATDAAEGGFNVDGFVRRYTRETRAWIGFHHDVSTCTINVALSSDAEHAGGRLHAIIGDGERARHTTIAREEGEAAAHGEDIMHAVSAMSSGTRYSLILFFYALSDAPESRAYQSVARSELYATGHPVVDSLAEGGPWILDEAAGGLLRRVGAGSSSGSQWSFVDDP
jgi:hypothetical protein